MADPLRSLVSRRRVLKVGVGVAAVAAATSPIEAAFAAGSSGATSDVMDGVGEIKSVVQQMGDASCDRTDVAVRMVGGQTISARLIGFPAGFMPRVGDLVAVDTRTTRALCAPVLGATVPQPTTVETVPTAHPLARWSFGTPIMKADELTIGAYRLVPSVNVLDAAHRNARIAVCTLDSTLRDRQVLATRTA